MATTLYIITTVIIFVLNMFANVAVMAFADNKKFPISTFLGTLFAMIFVIWGITLLVI